jgi:hypothetical protein
MSALNPIPVVSRRRPRALAFASLPAAISSGLPMPARLAHSPAMGTKSRETIYGSSIRASAELAAEARKEADKLACDAWNQRMLGYRLEDIYEVRGNRFCICFGEQSGGCGAHCRVSIF